MSFRSIDVNLHRWEKKYCTMWFCLKLSKKSTQFKIGNNHILLFWLHAWPWYQRQCCNLLQMLARQHLKEMGIELDHKPAYIVMIVAETCGLKLVFLFVCGAWVFLFICGAWNRRLGLTIRCSCICALLIEREEHHFHNHKNVLKSFLNMLHVEPDMMRFDYAHCSKNLKGNSLQKVCNLQDYWWYREMSMTPSWEKLGAMCLYISKI